MDNYNGQGVGLNEHDYESYIITIRRKHEARQSTVPVYGTDTQPDRKNEQLSKKTHNISLNDTEFHDFEEFSAPSSKNNPNSLLNGSQQERTIKTPSFTFCSLNERELGKSITSPLPGVILEVKVKEGETVKVGQVVAILEAMKMENEIQSEYDGIVISVNVSKDDNILEGTPIITVG